ncbi:MAG: NAD-dependent epimerase/dehydratase family protein [Planctomycetia bacterium]|nr:NAD-dependent epimerase/dehydratase family protein [Planctomycetia bacterium]
MNHSAGTTLVTGATGLVGNNVVRLLLARGERVRVLVRAETNRRALSDLDVQITTGDVRDADAVRSASAGAAAVIHCAGYVRIGWARPELYQSINVEGTRHVVDACRASGARLVFVSSSDVFGGCSLVRASDEDAPVGPGPAVPYVVTKRAAEGIVAQAAREGLNAVTVNPSFMLGPWDWKPSSGRLLLAVARGWAILAPRGWFSVCDVRDVAAGILAARDGGGLGRRYLLAGRTLQWVDAFRLFADVCGSRRPLGRAGPLMLKLAGWWGDCTTRLTGFEPDVNSAAVALAGLPKNYSSARAEAELGYNLRPIEETVRDAWAWFRQYEA